MLGFLQQEADHALIFWKQVYIFGSYITSCYPNDVDILLVYESSELSESKNELEKLKSVLSYKFNQLEFDFVLLNETELKEARFLNKVKYKQLK